MTHDEGQAKAAIEAGFEVVRPGRDLRLPGFLVNAKDFFAIRRPTR